VVGRNADAWRDAGMQGHVAKPFTLADISDCISRWVTRQPKSLQRPMADSEAQPLAAGVNADQTPSPVLDPSVLASIADMQASCGGLADRIIGLFVEHAPSKLSDLLVQAETHDSAELAAAAHALKSMCLNIGATRLASLCQEIETDAGSGVTALDAARCERLSTVMGETLAVLAADARSNAA
jgi:two-component system sensor histidine kinase BarA